MANFKNYLKFFMPLVLVIFQNIETSFSRYIGRARHCSEPDVDALHAQWLATHETERHESRLLPPSRYKHVSPSEGARRFPTRDSVNTSCPTDASVWSGIDLPLHMRSTCPWHFVSNFQADRYPRYLVEAECNCSKCLGHGPESEYRCHKLHYHVRVLLRTTQCDRAGVYKYTTTHQKLAVGCTCAAPPLA